MAASASISADVAVKSASSASRTGSKALIWVLLLVVVVLFAYQRMVTNKEQVLDQNYYRILYETGHSFSIRLEQLRRLCQFNAAPEVFRSQFPSLSEVKIAENIPNETGQKLQFELETPLLHIKNCGDGERSFKNTSVDQAEVLPLPRGGFSLLLIANDKGDVLARSGEENAVSFSNLNYVMRALKKPQSFALGNLFGSEAADAAAEQDLTMPGASRHVEVDLSYGRYRVYMYPLPLAENFFAADKPISSLYVVGLLPEYSFAAQKHDIAGFKLVLLSVASLLFLWTFLKVCLLPQHEAVPRWLISLCYMSSFAIFSLLVATLSVYFLEQSLLQQKTAAAKTYAEKVHKQVSDEFYQAFTALKSKETFFNNFLSIEQKCNDKSSWLECVATELKCTVYDEKARFDADTSHCAIEKLDANFSVVAHKVTDKKYLPLMEVDAGKSAWKFGFFPQSISLRQSKERELTSQANKYVMEHFMLNASVVSKAGNSRWPALYFTEHNTDLKPFSLAYREYFKRVKTNSGWTLKFKQDDTKVTFHNSYIQRLFNIDSGTRGTTISLPVTAKSGESLAGGVLIADVLLPALNVTEPPEHDFTYMVVDKISGAILYHSNNARTLIENAYYAGPDASAVKDFVQSQQQTDVLDDHYHGLAGRFVKHNMVVPDWQLLVFFPSQSLTLYGLVWFVILTLVPFITLSLMWILLSISRIDSGLVKRYLGLPKIYRRRWLFLQLALLLSLVCAACSYYLANGQYSCWQSLLWLLAGWLLVIGSSYKAFYEKDSLLQVGLKNSGRVYALLLLLCLPAILYLWQVQAAPRLALHHYYKQWQQPERQRELQELQQAALYLYPNATAKAAAEPELTAAKLLGIDLKLTQQKDPDAEQSMLKALPVLTSGSGYAYFWQLIRSVLYDFADSEDLAEATEPPSQYVLWYLLTLCLMLLLFVQYVERMLGARLCLSSAALRQLSRLVRITGNVNADTLSDKLLIEFKSVSLQGYDISAVINADAHSFHRQLNQLLQLSPVLRLWQKEAVTLPSLKLFLESKQADLLFVTLSDIEVCLEQRKDRDVLLQLLQELKALVISGKLAGLTLKSGFHSFQHLAVKDAFKSTGRKDELDHAEYLIWSECLMDFKVVMPASLKETLDRSLLYWEGRWCPHVRMLLQQDGFDDLFADLAKKPEHDNIHWWQRWFRGTPNEAALLAVQAYVLCHADAYYRFKWENCTKDEQLALYNLALGHQLNPMNITMMQNLALNGLLRVHRGRLKLVNSSFQQFVLNAEPQHKLQDLVREGEAGLWQQHRVTFAAIILTLMIAVAMTSGHSLHIIAVSVAGVLSTLVSVFSNASLLRSQFR